MFSSLQWIESLSFNSFFTSVLALSLISFLTMILLMTKTKTKNLPPSPPKLPLIGHMHKLGLYPHHSLHKLAQQYGPLMFLKLGIVNTLVVSSAEAASEIMKTHDLIFSDRPKSNVSKKLLYDYKDVSSAPYGEYWRQLRSICVVQLLSNKRVQSFRFVREEETAFLLKKIREFSPEAVNLSELFMTLTNDIVSRAAFGRKYSGGESGEKFRKLMKEVVGLLGGFDFGTLLPSLAWIDRLSGLEAKVERVAKEMDELLEGVVEEHLDSHTRVRDLLGERVENEKREGFVDVLLEIYKQNMDGFSIDRDGIKALILDIFAAGTDTTYTVLEWAMTELLRHPGAMNKLQNEAREIANGRNEIVSENDLDKMHYLKAVIKETLRLHPPIPLLVPRQARQDVMVMGYDVAAGTMVITNCWAIGRDPAIWDDAVEFKPERFLNSSIDFKGYDFGLIPFGAGRRGCPGISFAMAVNELVLANVVRDFDWELPNGTKGDDLDMTECTGLTIHRKVPLFAVATPYTS
ncbi:cytochrome P450 736A117-like [Lycium barbarum]|uniref:cytochrome P450 736A117-like n=1 Tax=Lycium barbarum TaxID=112863 RepID=UPI00293F1B34|nr:cytochrome P450 736A117-like [Lycium barbarum]